MISKVDYLKNITVTIKKANDYIDFVYTGLLIEFVPSKEGYEHYKKVLRMLSMVTHDLEELEKLIGGGAVMI